MYAGSGPRASGRIHEHVSALAVRLEQWQHECRRRRNSFRYRDLAAKGVEFVQQSAERAYGIEAVMRDNSGNWPVLVETRECTGEPFPH